MRRSASGWLLTRINRLEDWLSDTRSRLGLMPLRVAGYGLLLLAMMISNLWALLRWPFAVVGRMLVRPSSGENGAGRVIDVDETTLAALQEKPEPMLLDCWAEWCGPCVMMHRPLQDLAAESAGNLTVARLNTLHHPDLARTLGVRGLPTLILFQDGQEVRRHAGALGRHSLQAFVDGKPI